jgi:hypothetical protein
MYWVVFMFSYRLARSSGCLCVNLAIANAMQEHKIRFVSVFLVVDYFVHIQ